MPGVEKSSQKNRAWNSNGILVLFASSFLFAIATCQAAAFDGCAPGSRTPGIKPMKPENFTCVSHNWESLTCSWDPVLNYVATNYNLRFHFPGRAGGRAVYSCPQPKDDQPPNTCVLGAQTDPIYRQPQPYYNFTLNVSNHFGERSFPYLFNHYAHVIPSPPVDLKVVNKTFSSALLYWEIPYPLESFPPGLHSKISYLHDQTKTWENIIVTSDTGSTKNRYYNLTNLQYANAFYDIRVFLKSAVATDENLWSAFSSYTFKTAPTLPGQAPKTDIGSFQVEAYSSKRDIYIYWQMIPAFLENGDNFTYQVASVEQNGIPLDVTPSEKTKSYAKFRGMSHEHLKFVIVTANIVGANKTQAVVHVPKQNELPPEPATFTKIAFDNGIYELSWNPSSNAEITNYTIFWCENVRERPYQCKGYLDWAHVSANTSAYNITVSAQKNYQFAIAANTRRASSGMTWAACTAIYNKYIGKMNSMWMTSGSDSINVTWKLECSDRIDSIKGFVIYYCPILQPQNDSCKTPEKSETVYGGSHTSGGQLRGLKPYTTYRITIAALTKNGEGPRSDAMQYPTVEGAPTSPRDLKIKNVTNTSMVVEWSPPEAENGKVRYYTVYYGDKITKVEQPDEQKVTFVKIDDLQPYKKYTVSVSAQTVKEGNRSESKTQITEIGLPGKIEIPKVHFSNATQVQILWDPPKEAGGELDYYEILTSEGIIYSNITTRKKFLDISRCEEIGRETVYYFQVRAVNIKSQNEIFQGPWSTPGEAHCFNIGPNRKRGPVRPRGPECAKGEPGVRGISGPKGEHGMNGARGPPGPRGEPGLGYDAVCMAVLSILQSSQGNDLIDGGQAPPFLSNDILAETCSEFELMSKTPSPNTGQKESPAKTCKDLFVAYPDTPSGEYWIDPNEGDVSDAILVYCDAQERSTCLIPKFHRTRPFTIIGEERELWLSKLGTEMQITYGAASHQISALQMLSSHAEQKVTYHCVKSVGYFDAESGTYERGLKLLAWDDVELVPNVRSPFNYDVVSDGCQDRPNEWKKTVISYRTDRPTRLPVTDVGFRDVGKPDQHFSIEIGEVCFK